MTTGESSTHSGNPLPARTQVLIIGAGPVGQGLAIELGLRGIQCLVVDRNEQIGIAPRAKTTNVRTREHFRRWGIADALRDAAPFGADYPSNIVFTTRLSGHFLTRFHNALYCAPGRNPLYAEHAQWIPQYTVERVMRRHIETLTSVQVRLECELVGFEQTSEKVVATLRDVASGAESRVEASFLAGCDGGRSGVRNAIGAKMEGTFALSRNYNIVFRASGLAEAHSHGRAIMYWQINGEVPSHMGPMDSDDRWFFMPTGLAPDVQVTMESAAALIRRATGIDLPYEVLSVDEWLAHRAVADRYSDRRVFLAGDACHLHPPYGGFGMNMGVSDAVDLGWKLAATLQGWGGDALLDSYALERRPVHLHVLKEASTNHSSITNALFEEGLEDATPQGDEARKRVARRIGAEKLSEFYTLGTILGDCYADSPIVQQTSTAAATRDFLNYVPSTAPGSRAPHAWLHDGSSLFDHFGAGFTLLVAPNAVQSTGASDACLESAQHDATTLNVPLTICHARAPGMAALYPQRLTLIRPDQHVAWTGNVWPDHRSFDVLAMSTGRTSRLIQGAKCPEGVCI